MTIKNTLISSFALAVAAVAAFGSTANAGGLEGQPAIAANWSGLYVGGAIGGAWGKSHVDFGPSGFPEENAAPKLGDFIMGVHAGAQRQFGQIVAGIEVSYFAGEVGGSAPDMSTPGTINFDFEHIINVNGRLGVASGGRLFYVTGGYAAASVAGGWEQAGGGQKFWGSAWHSGWNIGAGIEWQISQAMVFGLEYRHMEFDNKVHGVQTGLGDRSFQADGNFDTVMARLSFKFDHAMPAAAPMK